jgi:hypothetical protein
MTVSSSRQRARHIRFGTASECFTLLEIYYIPCPELGRNRSFLSNFVGLAGRLMAEAMRTMQRSSWIAPSVARNGNFFYAGRTGLNGSKDTSSRLLEFSGVG